MNIKLLFVIIITTLLTSCGKGKKIDLTVLEDQIARVDSLNNKLFQHYDFTLKGIYKISEDSLLADSISSMIILSDTTVFYEFLSYKITELENLNYQTKQEILFAQDQLQGLMEDALKKQISNIQYELQLQSQENMISYLKELVNTNTNIINEIAEKLLINNDTIR